MISLKSETTKKLLNYFFLNPAEGLYVNEIAYKLKLDKRNLVKKIKELETEGIFKCHTRGNLKICNINKDYPLYGEYRKIILKTSGLEVRLQKYLQGIEGIKEAYIYGSYARDKLNVFSDIDLIVVGEHNIMLLQKILNKLQKETDRQINTVNIGEREFEKRIKNKDPFIHGVLKQEHIKII